MYIYICMYELDDLTVYNILCSTRECAAGPDEIPGIVLRKLASVLTRPLIVLFQQSIFSGRIPDPWRTAKVVPLFKGKGHRSDPNAYRPISLTSVVSKTLERLVVSQAQLFLDNNHFLSESQHGFRAGRSTTTNLIACDSRIASILNSGNQADLFLLDFARAFDKVNHSILIHKLNNLGFGSCLLRWISDWLNDRCQYVCIGSSSSKIHLVSSGVVQGSSAGPFFFNCFINDLELCLKAMKLYLFADDGKAVG